MVINYGKKYVVFWVTKGVKKWKKFKIKNWSKKRAKKGVKKRYIIYLYKSFQKKKGTRNFSPEPIEISTKMRFLLKILKRN